MTVVKLSSKNQIVLPKEAREAMQLKGRDELLVVVKDGITIILPKPPKSGAVIRAIKNPRRKEPQKIGVVSYSSAVSSDSI